MRGRARHGILEWIEETVITREELVALLFNVSDIAATLVRIERLLKEDDAEEDDEG